MTVLTAKPSKRLALDSPTEKKSVEKAVLAVRFDTRRALPLLQQLIGMIENVLPRL